MWLILISNECNIAKRADKLNCIFSSVQFCPIVFLWHCMFLSFFIQHQWAKWMYYTVAEEVKVQSNIVFYFTEAKDVKKIQLTLIWDLHPKNCFQHFKMVKQKGQITQKYQFANVTLVHLVLWPQTSSSCQLHLQRKDRNNAVSLQNNLLCTTK